MLALAAAVLFAFRMIAQTASYTHYDASYRRELAALDHVPKGVRLLTLVGSPCNDPWKRSRLNHLAGLALVRKSAFANDQWQLAAAPLLTVRRPDAIGFTNDPSQFVTPAQCPGIPKLRTIATALAAFPRGAFDYVWLIDPPRFDPGRLDGLAPVWRRPGGSALYRVSVRRSSRKPLSLGALAH
jgi:hypothetical protein